MSYAQVTASNTPANQPHPDPALFTTPESVSSFSSNENAKVHVVPNPNAKSDADNGPKKHKKFNKAAKDESFYLWSLTKQYMFRPGVAGGIIGLVNIGLALGAARSFYIDNELRRNPKVISSTVAAAAAILAVEGYGVEAYRKTAGGQEEERRAKEEGTLIYKHIREVVFRPGVLGGLVGLVNTGILATLGYFAYTNWDRPTWDRRLVTSVSVALLTLLGGEGYIAERYRESEH
ncbi:hypothetical protein C8J56DRAFT_1161352 [Mycena floridula]|nr:hypothetical protein C8J56DRAFT_1161352 [Mycena floridula]